MLAVEMSLGIERLDMSVQKEKGASISMKVFRIFHHHPIKFLAWGDSWWCVIWLIFCLF